ncbi:hypothetical protein DZF91_05940 [Actinomadura logoneensis]|uniref:Uncharacterized protein n=1 Tax=Actinomadura logoneensis TaxID=2293572 RepID=A0A372JRD7_9ACTN|nr:hypothetical protein [Actinomadura logoneensis]RFU42567.1 hypothetical protein DZF91_05940 [Actinomadura logoneensis]
MSDRLTEHPRATADYPADPADLFVRLYDELPGRLHRSWPPNLWYEDDRVRRAADELSERIIDEGALDPAETAALVAAEGDRGRFTLLLALDGALALANPYGPFHDASALTAITVRYLVDGRFDSGAAGGALLPRCALPGRPEGLRTLPEFFGVHRVPPDEWDGLEHSLLPAVHDPHLCRDEPVEVGCAPLMESFDELRTEFGERAGRTVYELVPADTAEIRARIRSVIRRLDEAGARIAVLPEATLSDGLLEAWKEAAHDTARPDSPLRLIMVGTGALGGGDPPPNRAVLIDRWTGTELLTQDKLSPFVLDGQQMRDWGLPGAPDSGTAEEDIAPGERVRLLDCSLGRLALLICEDLTRTDRWDRELLAAGASHLLTPIFSKPILRHRWEEQYARRHVTTLGAWVVVANSLVVGAGMPEDDPASGERHTCLVAGPPSEARLDHAALLAFGSSGRGDEPGRLADGRLPVLHAGAAHEPWYPHWSDDLSDGRPEGRPGASSAEDAKQAEPDDFSRD